MTIGPGASENEVSAAAASTMPRLCHCQIGTERWRHVTRPVGRLGRMVQALLALVVPPICVACRRAGDVARSDPLCRACRQALPWLGASRCARCGLPAPCGPRCPARAQAFSGAWAPVAYAGAVPALVNALKERGAVGWAPADGRADRRDGTAGVVGGGDARSRARRSVAPAPSRRRPRGAAGGRARATLRAAGGARARPAAAVGSRQAGRSRAQRLRRRAGGRLRRRRGLRARPRRSSSTTSTPRAPRCTPAPWRCGRPVRGRAGRHLRAGAGMSRSASPQICRVPLLCRLEYLVRT